jgi:hypothetical protein
MQPIIDLLAQNVTSTKLKTKYQDRTKRTNQVTLTSMLVLFNTINQPVPPLLSITDHWVVSKQTALKFCRAWKARKMQAHDYKRQQKHPGALELTQDSHSGLW